LGFRAGAETRSSASKGPAPTAQPPAEWQIRWPRIHRESQGRL